MSTARTPTDRFLNHAARGDVWKALLRPLPKAAPKPDAADPRDLPRVEDSKCKVRR